MAPVQPTPPTPQTPPALQAPQAPPAPHPQLAQLLRGGLQVITLGLEADARALLAARDTICKAPVYPGDDTHRTVEDIMQKVYRVKCVALCIYAGAYVAGPEDGFDVVADAAAAEWAALTGTEGDEPLPPPHAPVAESPPHGLAAQLVACVGAAMSSVQAVADTVEGLVLTAGGDPDYAALRAALAGHAEGVAPALAAFAAARRVEMLAEILEDLIGDLLGAEGAEGASAPAPDEEAET